MINKSFLQLLVVVVVVAPLVFVLFFISLQWLSLTFMKCTFAKLIINMLKFWTIPFRFSMSRECPIKTVDQRFSVKKP